MKKSLFSFTTTCLVFWYIFFILKSFPLIACGLFCFSILLCLISVTSHLAKKLMNSETRCKNFYYFNILYRCIFSVNTEQVMLFINNVAMQIYLLKKSAANHGFHLNPSLFLLFKQKLKLI